MNKLIKLFIFFSAFPCIKIFDLSITLYIFLFIVIANKSIKIGFFKSKLFFFLFVSILISSYLSFYYDQISHPGVFFIFKIIIQYFYWICVALFFKKYFFKLNINDVFKYFFIGLSFFIFSFLVFEFTIDLGFLIIDTQHNRNFFIFNLLATSPFAYMYLLNNYHLKKYLKFFVLVIFIAMFLSQGRSGILILLIQSFFIFIIIYKKNVKLYLRIFVVFIISISLFSTTFFQTLESLSYTIEPYNPRLAGFIRQDGESDIANDKSLNLRLMMIDKTKEIFSDHPFFGVGPNIFRYYNAPLNFRNQYPLLSHHDDKFINSKSAHGTYYQVLAEFGLVGLVFFLLLIIIPLFTLFKKFLNNNFSKNDLLYVSLLGISFHFISVSAINGTITWLVFGIVWSLHTLIRN